MPKRNIPLRNPVARSPILRKGGAHVQPKSGQRACGRRELESLLDEWLDQDTECESQGGKNKGSKCSPDFLIGLQ